jgi:hypothetical protein
MRIDSSPPPPDLALLLRILHLKQCHRIAAALGIKRRQPASLAATLRIELREYDEVGPYKIWSRSGLLCSSPPASDKGKKQGGG